MSSIKASEVQAARELVLELAKAENTDPDGDSFVRTYLANALASLTMVYGRACSLEGKPQSVSDLLAGLNQRKAL